MVPGLPVPFISGRTHEMNALAEANGIGQSHGVSPEAAGAIAEGLRTLLADVFALYLKTKNFHWHVRGPLFPLYHEMLDEQAAQVFAMTDPLAERTRKLGQPTLLSIGDIARRQRIQDNDAPNLPATAMMTDLLQDTRMLITNLQDVHELCAAGNDFATASVIENWIDESEQRAWALAETVAG